MAMAAGAEFINIFGGKVDKIPGVYSQGLVVYGPDGELIHEEFCDSKVINKCMQFCYDHNLTVLAYSCDRIFCKENNYYTKKVMEYNEPLPEEYSLGIENLLRDNIQINKLIILDDEENLIKIRPAVEAELNGIATITRAVPGTISYNY